MLKRILVVTGLLMSANCAAGEEIDFASLHANGSSGAGGDSVANNPGNSGGSNTNETSGSNVSTGQSGSNGQSGSGGAPQSDASTGSAGQNGTGGASGSGGSAAGASGAAGSGNVTMSDAGFVAGFQILYGNMQTGTSSAYIGCELHAKNGGSSTAAVSDLKIRYYFTNDVAKTPQFKVNWSHVSNAGGQWDMTVTSTVNALTPAKNNADTYLEFSLSSAAHTNLSPNESADFSWQVQGPDPSKDKYTQTNDYSWDAGRTSPQQWDHVVLLNNGTVVWGTPP